MADIVAEGVHHLCASELTAVPTLPDESTSYQPGYAEHARSPQRDGFGPTLFLVER